MDGIKERGLVMQPKFKIFDEIEYKLPHKLGYIQNIEYVQGKLCYVIEGMHIEVDEIDRLCDYRHVTHADYDELVDRVEELERINHVHGDE